MSLGTILLIILILLLIGGLPVFPHSRNWGYGLGSHRRIAGGAVGPVAAGHDLGPIGNAVAAGIGG